MQLNGLGGAPAVSSRVLPLESGQAPLVLLHAAASSRLQWHGVQRALADRYRLLAPDLLGGGAPGSDIEPLGVVQSDVALVRQLVQRVGVPVHLVGHSYGGLVALRASQSDPAIARSLLLFEPIALDLVLRGGSSPDALELQEMSSDIDVAICQGELHRAAERFVDYWSGWGTYRGLPAPSRAAIASTMTRVSLVWHEILESSGDYGAVAPPTTVLYGQISPSPIRSVARRLAERLRRVRTVEVPGAGHQGPLTHAALVASEIRRHVAWSDGK